MSARRTSSSCGCRTVGYKWVAPCADHAAQFQETQDSTWQLGLALPPVLSVDSEPESITDDRSNYHV